MKVAIRDKKTGTDRSVPRAHARVLVALGQAEYSTRALTTEGAGVPVVRNGRAPRGSGKASGGSRKKAPAQGTEGSE